ncbi:uncharacterized protein LOC121639889 [Melanotaenia boesemani]|uniref:uncharacterized protein LOC121639889 n=1 Tax=Melanotaenia boesemani TaxID=1250792 RepID=UPI001C03BA08|nr:uncharacterized protein LOC121639889 [Melanotaenia boesemani]XP_041841417.1 uncharacterized protein LOC121639889 [Melanotaenia boesemani]
MAPPVFAGCVMCLFLGAVIFSAALSSAQKTSSSLHFESVDVGQDVKLDCSYEDGSAVVFFWYKQTLGHKPQLISKFFKHKSNGSLNGEFGKDSRFALETSRGKNDLKISNVQISDSATYYCVSGYSYVFEHLAGIIVHVKSSVSIIQTSVYQSESDTTRDSKTLSCTVQTGICDEEHSVYWFKDSGEALSREIYTYRSGNDQCEQNTNTQTHTCVYNLKMASAGTYYCAVASCGQILFGNGTKLEDSSLLLQVLSGALVFSNILVVILTYTVCKTKSNRSKDPPSAATAPHAESHQDENNLHYAALRDMKFSGSRRERGEASRECVYSSVKQ